MAKLEEFTVGTYGGRLYLEHQNCLGDLLDLDDGFDTLTGLMKKAAEHDCKDLLRDVRCNEVASR